MERWAHLDGYTVAATARVDASKAALNPAVHFSPPSSYRRLLLSTAALEAYCATLSASTSSRWCRLNDV